MKQSVTNCSPREACRIGTEYGFNRWRMFIVRILVNGLRVLNTYCYRVQSFWNEIGTAIDDFRATRE